MTLTAEKIEIQKQWDTDPCGADTAANHRPGTLAFYRAIRNHRYQVYAPWFGQAVGFSDWADSDILEIGVGLGSDHFMFARSGNRMTALDLSREHLRHTVRHLQLEGLSTSAVYGDAERMAFRSGSFDLVYAFGVLHHTPATEVAIAEVHRVLRPGGTALIGLYHRDSWFFWLNTVGIQGFAKAGLARKGLRTLMSEIEHRHDRQSARPLVKVYSRHAATRLLSAFRQVELMTWHVEPSHLRPFGGLVRNWSRDELERRLGFGGWYVIARATK